MRRASSSTESRSAAALLAARVRNDAVGAELVAAFDDGDVSAMRIAARGELGLESLIGLAVVETGDAGCSCFDLHQHLWQIAVRCRAGDQRDIGRALENLLAFLLGHAAQHGKLLALLLQLLDVIQTVEDFLLGLIANRAGVIEDEVGIFLAAAPGDSLRR